MDQDHPQVCCCVGLPQAGGRLRVSGSKLLCVSDVGVLWDLLVEKKEELALDILVEFRKTEGCVLGS